MCLFASVWVHPFTISYSILLLLKPVIVVCIWPKAITISIKKCSAFYKKFSRFYFNHDRNMIEIDSPQDQKKLHGGYSRLGPVIKIFTNWFCAFYNMVTDSRNTNSEHCTYLLIAFAFELTQAEYMLSLWGGGLQLLFEEHPCSHHPAPITQCQCSWHWPKQLAWTPCFCPG